MNRTGTILVILCLLLVSAIIARTGGPDAFGYRFVDSDEPGGPEFEWIDISTSGSLGPSGDDSRTTVSLPSSFEYYGSFYNQLTICTNGWVCFGSTTTSGYNLDTIPSTSYPQNLLALCYMDLTTGSGRIRYATIADGRFVVSYLNVSELGSSSNIYEMQVVLNFEHKSIQYNYLNVSPVSSSYRKGGTGIENNTGTIGLFYGWHRSTGTALHDSLSIVFRSNIVIMPPYFNNCYVADDFETEGTGWELGRPTTVGPSMPPSFPYCWCTLKDANYNALMDCMLYLPRMIISDCGQPIFDWWQWYEIDSCKDGGVVELSTNDGVSWFSVDPEGGYPCSALDAGSALSGSPAFTGSSGDWEYQSVDLAPWVGSGEIRMRFRFASDASNEYAGWYIDDVGISEVFGVIWGYVDLGYRTDESGAEIEALGLDITDISDDSGYYFLDSIKVGTWDVSCTRDSFLPELEVGVSVARDETVRVDFYLSPVLMATNFDTNSAGGVPTPNGGWQWGRPDSLVPPPGQATGPAGTDSLCWGTNLGGNYTNNANWTLDFTIFLVADYPALSIWHWYKFAGEYAGHLWDGCCVRAKGLHDTVFSEPIAPVAGYDGPISDHNPWLGGKPGFGGLSNGDFWHYDKFFLYEWAMDTAIIRFEIAADGAGTQRGWYIDNMVIIDDPSGTNSVGEEYLRPKDISITAYPNPFNPTTTLEYDLPENCNVDISIYDISGHLVKKLLEDEYYSCGLHKIVWDGLDNTGATLPTGLYLARIKSGEHARSIKLVLLK